MENIIGRKAEYQALEDCIRSQRSELVVVYGRRRVGKTFLIRHFFKDKYDFMFVGKRGMAREQQLSQFSLALRKYSGIPIDIQLKTWVDAFNALAAILESSPNKGKKVVFLDEMPWMDSHRSDFVVAIEDFWNSWANMRDDIVLIACGSATSWMVDRIMHNQGGLFNRVTKRIFLHPFRLCEVEEYLTSHQIRWDRYQILQCYMIFGGVPYYLSLLNRRLSLAGNVDELFFSGTDAPMRLEYGELYTSLFKFPEKYLTIVKALASRRSGFTRQELSAKTKLTGASLTKVLQDLEQSDFIFSRRQYGVAKSNLIYRLKDFYSFFYFKFVDGSDVNSEHLWSQLMSTPSARSWMGFSFELLCLLHIEEIKRSLRIDAIITDATGWRVSPSEDGSPGAQIDLVIDRADRVIDLCEIKFSTAPYVIDEAYALQLRERMALFRSKTKTRHALRTVFISPFGALQNMYSSVVDQEVKAEGLFS